MKKYTVACILFVILGILFQSPNLEAVPVRVNIATSDGLSDASPISLLQDSYGRVWIGTWNGLNVYDGHSFDILYPGRESFPDLPSTTFNKLIETSPGIIWTATSYGVCRIEYDRGLLSTYMLGYEGKSTPDYASFSIASDSAGNVFASSYGWGLTWYDQEADLMVPLQYPEMDPTEIRNVECGPGNSLYILSKDGSVQKITYGFAEDGMIELEASEYIFRDYSVISSHNIGETVCFVSSDSRLLFDKKDENGGYCHIMLPVTSDVTDICMGDNASLYVSFVSSETYRVDMTNGISVAIGPLAGRKVMTLHLGNQGVLWAGIKGGGVDALYNDASYFGGIRNSEIFGDKVGAVSCFLETSDGRLFFGTEGNGICVKDAGGRISFIDVAAGLANNTVYSMSFIGDGEDVLIGRYGPGIDVFKDGKVFTLYSPTEDYLGDVYSICKSDEPDEWWFGTFNYGLVRAVIKEGADGRYHIQECCSWTSDKNPDLIKGDFISSLLMSPNGRLIAGTTTAGMFVFDPDKGEAVHYISEMGKATISNNGVFCMCYGRDSTIWVGTGNGINNVTVGEDDSLTFISWNEKDGLFDPTVHGVLEDSMGRAWLSTNDGISCVDPNTSMIMNFPNDPSLQSDEFTNGSAYIGKDGTFYLGGVSGYNSFDPLSISIRDYIPDIHFNQFSVRQNPIIGFRAMDVIELAHDENFFSISFSALDFIDNENCEYRYKLKGFDNSWVEAGENNRASYTNVPPGRYEFVVCSTNGDKIWGENSEFLYIRIRRPWWNTIYAYLFYLSILLTIIHIIKKFRHEKAEGRRRLEAERQEKQQQKDIYEAKLMFFTNIAHEFSSPLTLISSASEILSEGMCNYQKSKKYLSIISNSSSRMQRLIQELIEFRKVDTGNYQLHYSIFDVASLCKSILDDFSEIGKYNNVVLNSDVPESLMVVSDKDAVEKIIGNLISNAYKYTPARGEISISLSGGVDRFSLMVKNSGKGLSERQISRIFDRFTVLDNFESHAVKGKGVRNGIGMALVKSYVNMLNGDIAVSSNEGEYVQFDVKIPVQDKTCVDDAVSQALIKPDIRFDIIENTAYVSEAKSRFVDAPTLMIVDDDPEIRAIVCDIFDGEYNIIQAADGQHAIELLKRERPDLMLVDINMPKMGGIELVSYLRSNEITKMIPIAFLTFNSDLDVEMEANELGCEAFIPKPFSPKLLSSTVRRIIGNRNLFKDYYRSSVSNKEIYDSNVVSNDEKKFIMKLTIYIEDNMQFSKLSQEELAEAMNVSKSEFYLRVKRITGIPPVEFVRNIKLEKAAHLLKTTDMTAQEIMYIVGFSNKSYFYREFAKCHGMSPIEFRKNS